jgi:ubiquitin-activating enzyme E1
LVSFFENSHLKQILFRFCRTFTLTEIDASGAQKKVPAPISFYYCFNGGCFGTLFVDHGDKHIITDANGERPLVRIVTDITCEENGLVRFVIPDGEKAESLPDGCSIEFEDVEGMFATSDAALESRGVNLNKSGVWKTSRSGKDPVNTLRIGDTRGFSPYIGGGTFTERKQPVETSFRSLATCITHPGELPMTDMINFGSEYQQHVALQATLDFQQQNDRLPTVNSQEDADAVVAVAQKFVDAMKTFNASTPNASTPAIEVDVDADLVKKFAVHAAVDLQPMGAFLGGVLAQEVVKAGGKYTPIPGFLHFSAPEALPSEPPTDTAPCNSRYDNLISIFGKAFVEELGNIKYFMVGCGALGCEFLKNFALNGVCCGPAGKLTVTDADRVELSNLARQFLFREDTVGKAKSTSACKKATEMNPAFCPEALEMFVGPNTESHFNDAFWQDLDGICNALDNMEARFYVDAQCVKYGKSLLESGTMGTSGNVDPIVPYKTKTYRDGGEAVEGGGIPMCTLRNFPHLIDHCIEWSRDQFEAIFVKPVKRAKVFAEDPESFILDLKEKAAGDASAVAKLIPDVSNLIKTLKSASNASMESCAQLAFDYFHALFRDKLIDLINLYPKDARVIKDGVDKGPFWSEKKRFPTPANYDPTNNTHCQFMLATTHLVAQMLGAEPPYPGDDSSFVSDQRSNEWINEMVSKLKVPEYVKTSVDNDEEGESKENNSGAADAETESSPVAELEALIAELEKFRGIEASTLEPADFEKDDDYNFHIDFITGASNMRASNYSIPFTDFGKAKLVAGKIIPAIATTTAAVTGLVMLELFKMVQKKEIESFRARQIGLAVNTFTSFEPDPPITKTSGVKLIEPEAASLTPDDFDETGKVKKSSYIEERFAAYPDKHSCWDKIIVPSDMTLADLVTYFDTTHHLKLSRWGLKNDPYVYPPKPTFDESVLPELDLPKNKAFMAIRSNNAIPQKDKMTVLALWEKAKATGQMPQKTKSTLEMTITELLSEKGGVDITGRSLLWLEGISFVGTVATMPSPDTPEGSLEGLPIEVPEVYLQV